MSATAQVRYQAVSTLTVSADPPVSLVRAELLEWTRSGTRLNLQWSRIAPMLPGKIGYPGRTALDNRLFVNALPWVLRSGARWSNLPERCGRFKSVHKAREFVEGHFTRWSRAGMWERVFGELSATATTSI